ncbi:YciI family protein [Nocardioides cynanchi]|uniref:YciI family protein n=1 Tax=Nocardioides cynanchi TaxID=2558918 RepID=UPI00124858B6|nr:YciI family protein [Nocardioides cynanchi]
MSEYVVMFPADNEAEWEAGSEADHQTTYDTDLEFGRLLEARGGAVTGGAGLTHSSRARTVRRGPSSDVLVTDGPFAEAVEQLSGFYIVTCDDYDAVVEAAHVLTRVHPVVEIRPVQED